MATADRRLDVLRAIVSDYVATREPVGSKSLAQRYDLGVSPATIRNDMAALEEANDLPAAHFAGRIPTVQGYRAACNALPAGPCHAGRRAVESWRTLSI